MTGTAGTRRSKARVVPRKEMTDPSAAGAVVGVVALAVLAGAGDAQAQELIAQTLGEGGRGAGEVDLLAARDAAVGLQQPLDQGQGLVVGQVAEAAGDALVAGGVVEVGVGEGEVRLVEADVLASGSAAGQALADGPLDLEIGVAAAFSQKWMPRSVR